MLTRKQKISTLVFIRLVFFGCEACLGLALKKKKEEGEQSVGQFGGLLAANVSAQGG